MKKTKLILAGVILLQIIVQIFVANGKQYIHMDEGYSLGLMNYDKVEIQDNYDFYNTWHNGEYYEDYLSVKGNESYKVVYENQKNDVHPPLYYLLLRVVSSFNNGEFSKWPGIGLNILINIFCTILVYLICKKLFGSEQYSLLIAGINGITMSTLNTILYIRMYELSAFNVLLTLYLCLRIVDGKVKIQDYIFLGISALIGSLTHYYYLFFLATIYIIFIVKCIKKKEYKNAIKLTVTMAIAGVCSLVIFPYSVNHMFKGNRGTGAISNLSNIGGMFNNLRLYLDNLTKNIFGIKFWMFALVIIVAVIIKAIRNKKFEIQIKNKSFLLVCIPTIVYFLLVAIMSPYIELRYIMPICPLVLIITIYFLRSEITAITNNKITGHIISGLLVIIVMLPIIFNQKLEMQYYDKKEIVSKLENEYNLPTIYLFNKENNRFLDDILLFSKIDESYVYDLEDLSTEKIKEIFEGKDISNGIIVFINEGQKIDENLKLIKEANSFNEINYLKRMNACDIYYLK